MDDLRYAREFSEESFWEKVGKYALVAGREVIEKALVLWYVLRKPEVPPSAKAVIIGALGYFICPADVIPDMVLGLGYTDDLGVLALALATVSIYIDDDIKDKARKKTEEWFGLINDLGIRPKS
jgi:uncharacterized membrane protein YkvA (DUF1232 family)